MARDRRRRWAAAALALLASTAAPAGCVGGRSTIGERAPRCGRRARQKDITLGGRRISADGVPMAADLAYPAQVDRIIPDAVKAFHMHHRQTDARRQTQTHDQSNENCSNNAYRANGEPQRNQDRCEHRDKHEQGMLAQRTELLVGQRHRTRQPHANALVGSQAEGACRFPDRLRGVFARLH